MNLNPYFIIAVEASVFQHFAGFSSMHCMADLKSQTDRLRIPKKKWCSICYHNGRDKNGIIDENDVKSHYITKHIAEKNKWPKTEMQKAYFVNFNQENEPILYDNVSTRLLSKRQTDAPIFMVHKKTEQDIVRRIDSGEPYAIAWYL